MQNEIRKNDHDLKQGSGVSKNMEMGLRDTTMNLHKKEDETRKLEHEIDQLRAQITEKEKQISEIKGDTRDLARVKEEFRRSGELGHFTLKGEEEHLHEHQLKLRLLSQDKLRKENEFKHKEEMGRTLHREVNFQEQEVTQIQAELSKIFHSS